MSFDPPIKSVIKDVTAEVKKTNADAFKADALQLFRAIVTETPVDKGTARGGWQPSIGVPNLAGGPPNANATVDRLPPNPKLLPYILSNPLPYVEVLEFGGYGTGPGATEKTGGTGFSKLAPHGMIRINMRELGFL